MKRILSPFHKNITSICCGMFATSFALIQEMGTGIGLKQDQTSIKCDNMLQWLRID